MRLTVNINNVIITLDGENNSEIMAILNKIMGTQPPRNEILNEFKTSVMGDVHNEPSVPYYPQPPVNFTPCSDKQKKLLSRIPEFINRDLDNISRREAGEAIEKWNKSRGVHYGDHY